MGRNLKFFSKTDKTAT